MNLHPHYSQETSSAPGQAASDEELVTLTKHGNIIAFEAIMRRYNQRLYRIARSILNDEHEALDVVQDTYIKVYYQLEQFNGPGGFAGWLSRIASNEALMKKRKSNRITYILDDPKQKNPELEPFTTQTPEDAPANQQLGLLLEEAIETLPIDYRSVYVMRAVQQLSTVETAHSLDITADTVKTRYSRAKRALQKVFEGHIEKTGLNIYEFAGHRCDAIVHNVLNTLQSNSQQ